MSAQQRWPYIHETLEIGGSLDVSTQSYDVTISSLECDGQMVCMISSDNMTFDEIMDRLNQLAKRYHEEGIVTDEVNGSEYSVW